MYTLTATLCKRRVTCREDILFTCLYNLVEDVWKRKEICWHNGGRFSSNFSTTKILLSLGNIGQQNSSILNYEPQLHLNGRQILLL